jgi:hypothetical protein
MPERALTETARQDAPQDKHLWASIDRLVRENPEDVRQGSRPADLLHGPVLIPHPPLLLSRFRSVMWTATIRVRPGPNTGADTNFWSVQLAFLVLLQTEISNGLQVPTAEKDRPFLSLHIIHFLKRDRHKV